MNSDNIIFLLPGQGVQYFKMGLEMYTNNSDFKEILNDINHICIEKYNTDVIGYLFDGSKNFGVTFDEFRYSHPAIFSITYSLASILIKYGVVPQYFMGTSLGEFIALPLTGVLSLEQSIDCIFEQVNLFTKNEFERKLYAVNTSLDKLKQSVGSQFDVVSYNYLNHNVIAVDNDKSELFCKTLADNAIIHLPLPLKYAFHTNTIDNAFPDVYFLQKKYTLTAPKYPIISCAQIKIGATLDENLFWTILRYPIQFEETMKLVCENIDNPIFIDLSPTAMFHAFTENIFHKGKPKVYKTLDLFRKDVHNINIVKHLN